MPNNLQSIYELTPDERAYVDQLNLQAAQIQQQANAALTMLCKSRSITGAVEYRDGALWSAPAERTV